MTMTLLLAMPLLASIGLLYAGLWAVYVRALNGDRPIVAAILDAIVTSFGFIAWAIMAQTGRENSAGGIAAYAFGGAVGTYITLRMKKARVQIPPLPPDDDQVC
jgi:uncharacterized BrkB/YihY/UPF0761 family membrane protein